jgi:hypothetical protein
VGSAKSERNHRKTGLAPKKTRRSSGGGANRPNGRPAVVRSVEVEGTSQEDLATEAAEVTRKRKDPKKRRKSLNRANGRVEDVGSVEVEGTSQDLAVEAAEVTRNRKDPPKKRRRSSGGGTKRANGRSVAVGSVQIEGTSQDLATEAAEVIRKRKDPSKKRRKSSVVGVNRANGRLEDVGTVEVEGTSQDLAAEVTRKPPKKRMSVLAKKKMRGIQRRKRKRENAERFVQKYPPVFSGEFRLLVGDFRRFYHLAIPFKHFFCCVLIRLYKFL